MSNRTKPAIQQGKLVKTGQAVFDENGKPICGAMTNAGTPCRRAPMANHRCYVHGGPTPKGIASSNWKGGRYSKYLPERLLEKYGESLQDPELIVLRDELALFDARIADLLKRVDSGEAGALWKAAKVAYARLRTGMAANDKTIVLSALSDLDAALGEGAGDYAAWTEIEGLMSHRRRIAEAETRRLVQAQQMLTAEQALGMVAAIADIIKREVTDREALTRISNGITDLITRTTQQPTPTGD